MTDLPAFEASSFSHALGTFLRGEILKPDHVYVHSVGVMSGPRGLGVLDSEAWVPCVPP